MNVDHLNFATRCDVLHTLMVALEFAVFVLGNYSG